MYAHSFEVTTEKAILYVCGLPIDLTDCMRLPSDHGVRYEACKQRIRKALTAYCDDDNIEVRRACHRVWPTPSAPIATIVFTYALRVISEWDKVQSANPIGDQHRPWRDLR